MGEPRADRPHMPGYGVQGPDEGVDPTWAFGLTQGDFGGSPTRWTFSG